MTITDNLTIEDCLRAVRELRIEVAELRLEVARRDQQLATEIRTNRLTVLDDAGREVANVHGLAHSVGCEIKWWPEGTNQDHAAVGFGIYAGEESGPLEAVCYSVDGNAQTDLHSVNGTDLLNIDFPHRSDLAIEILQDCERRGFGPEKIDEMVEWLTPQLDDDGVAKVAAWKDGHVA